MRSILSFLGLGGAEAEPAAETATVRKIVARLEALPPERARLIAAFAYVLSRVANADQEISQEETRAMEALVERHGRLPPAQAVLVVEIAKSQNRLFGGTEDFLVTRELASIVPAEEREKILDCLFAVATADGEISAVEEHQIRLIADQLGMPPRTFLELRRRYNEQRSVIRRLQRDAER
ncbi:MAG: TerB family tellurite resistance protein [Acidobacteria bacterium]|nr:MAG: TerB family tellurite resistance protein [Acidobacteriota bacterium]